MSDEQMPNIHLTHEQWEWFKANELARNADAAEAHRHAIAASLVAAETMRAQEARYQDELRDRFAMAALATLPNDWPDEKLVRYAFATADAMMEASKK